MFSQLNILAQDSFMTILLMCGMFGLPTTKLTSILAVDWLLDRLDGLCKVPIIVVFVIMIVMAMHSMH